MGAEKGVYDSFYEFFGEDGISFNPHPEKFREFARKNPPPDPPPPRNSSSSGGRCMATWRTRETSATTPGRPSSPISPRRNAPRDTGTSSRFGESSRTERGASPWTWAPIHRVRTPRTRIGFATSGRIEDRRRRFRPATKRKGARRSWSSNPGSAGRLRKGVRDGYVERGR